MLMNYGSSATKDPEKDMCLSLKIFWKHIIKECFHRFEREVMHTRIISLEKYATKGCPIQYRVKPVILFPLINIDRLTPGCS